jgi:hypothetical protein
MAGDGQRGPARGGGAGKRGFAAGKNGGAGLERTSVPMKRAHISSVTTVLPSCVAIGARWYSRPFLIARALE